MVIVNSERLSEACNDVIAALEEHPDLQQKARAKFDNVNSSLDLTVVNYCVSQYLDAEMDYITPGERGIGRASTLPPRFGAYFRKHLASLSDAIREELLLLTQSLILRGYVAAIAVGAEVNAQNAATDNQTLYRMWALTIYRAPPPPEIAGILEATSLGAFNRLKDFLAIHRMVGGGLFSRDKTDLILAFYPLAGYLLRTFAVKK